MMMVFEDNDIDYNGNFDDDDDDDDGGNNKTIMLMMVVVIVIMMSKLNLLAHLSACLFICLDISYNLPASLKRLSP